jgi:predicted nucleic acid-binding protein
MAVTKSNIRAICDAGPVIHLDELNCLDLLCDFQEIILADTVWKEVKYHRPGVLKKPDIHFMRASQGYPEGQLLRTMCRIFSLDAGETEALAIIEKNPDAMFLTDDACARLVADRMGFEVHGTIGIIVRAIRREFMQPEQVLQILAEVTSKSSLHIRPSLLERIIGKVKEEFQL